MRKNNSKCKVNKHFFFFWRHDATRSVQHNLDNGQHIQNDGSWITTTYDYDYLVSTDILIF